MKNKYKIILTIIMIIIITPKKVEAFTYDGSGYYFNATQSFISSPIQWEGNISENGTRSAQVPITANNQQQFNIGIRFDYNQAYQQGGNYAYSNVEDSAMLEYEFQSINNPLYQDSNGYITPFRIGPGWETPLNNLQWYGDTIKYISFDICVSRTTDWSITQFYTPSSYQRYELVGAYINNNLDINEGIWRPDEPKECILAVNTDNNGIVTVMRGILYTIVGKTNASYIARGGVNDGRITNNVLLTIKNTGNNTMFISMPSPTIREGHGQFLTENPKNEYEYQQKLIQKQIYDFYEEYQDYVQEYYTNINYLVEFDLNGNITSELDTTKEQNYNTQETALLNTANNMDLTNLNVTLNANAQNSIWNMATQLLNTNTKILTLMISSLTLAIIKMIDGR